MPRARSLENYRSTSEFGLRATTNELINQLRYELWAHSLKTHLTGFSQKTDHDQNGIKCNHPLESALFLRACLNNQD